ncbi:MAG: hypothetical protein LC689_20835, partial [Myxococcales bacterium]|nr:hypothetical protein [Myxococcales bacterium]
MRTAIIGIAAAAAVTVVAPRQALACGQGGNYGALYAVALTALAVGTVDAGMFVVDGVSMLADHPLPRGYAVFEAIWTIPQFALGAYTTVAMLSRPYPGNDAAAPAIYTAAMALM